MADLLNDTNESALWQGDHGTLDKDTRILLSTIIKGPMLEGRRKRRLWEQLLRNETLIRSRLNDMFLELVIDRPSETAFIRQVQPDFDVPILLRKKSINYAETFLLLMLRRQYITAVTRTERAAMTLTEILENLDGLRRTYTDHVTFERHIRSAVLRAVHFGVLRRLRHQDHYEITPLVEYVVTAEFTERVKKYYELGEPKTVMTLMSSTGAGAGDEPAAGDPTMTEDGPAEDDADDEEDDDE